eukprot:s1278_g4.t1
MLEVSVLPKPLPLRLVIPTQVAGDLLCGTEFNIWSVILSAWSEVFERMLSRDFVESTKKEERTHGLYKGTVDAPPEALCEVSVIADKYQVLQLKNLCLKTVEAAINEKNVWAIFQSADEFQVQDIRQKSKDKILMEAQAVLETRPLVRDKLLEEVFASCLIKWTDAPNQISSKTLVDRWVSMAKTPKRKRGEHATDLIRCVKSRFDTFSQGKSWNRELGLSRPMFLANWVFVSYALAKSDDASHAFLSAENNMKFKLRAGDWIEWRLPKFGAHLMGIEFTETLQTPNDLEIFCAADCSERHRVFSSKEYGNVYLGFGGSALVKCGCQHLVQRFKAHIISGEFQLPGIKIQGILAEM